VRAPLILGPLFRRAPFVNQPPDFGFLASIRISPSSFSFESPSRLRRIEPRALLFSSCQSIVPFIDGSAFENVKLPSCDIEFGNDRFVIENEFLIGTFSKSSDIAIPSSIAILRPSFFRRCESLGSISFESPSRLPRNEMPQSFRNRFIYDLRDAFKSKILCQCFRRSITGTKIFLMECVHGIPGLLSCGSSLTAGFSD
jgi:hypothetical protein